MENFIYVFCEEDRDVLLRSGYKLLKEGKESNVYVFVNSGKIDFGETDITYVLSNTITF